MKNEAIIVGAFLEIIELAEELGIIILGMIDNLKIGDYSNYPILCNDHNAIGLQAELKRIPLIITPDLPIVRYNLYILYEKHGFTFRSLISNDSKISKSAKIKNGTIVQSGVTVSAECLIGSFVKLNSGCIIMHNSIIADFTTVAPRAVILGNVKIGKSCYIGANSTILPNLAICDNSIIGAGAVVTKNILKPGKYVGIPAKQLLLSNEDTFIKT
jgi:UDP-N-acetylbacillosamine N-acetyltransferase